LVERFAIALALVALVAGCGGEATRPSSGPGPALNVVAAENSWGSIASQLGGDRARVQSVVTDPNADPHEYESSTDDARAFATADLVIVNGAGYDDWSQRLLAASPRPGRRVLDVASLLGKKDGDNPHFWYAPQWVVRVAGQITAELKSADPAHASYFDQRHAAFRHSLEPYLARVAEIKRRFAGVKIGATESVFTYMAQALGLDLISPPAFMDAVAEGNDPPASAVVAFQNQLAQRQIKVLIYNTQTASRVTITEKRLAASHDVPVVGVSETLQPVSASFQEWQLAQLVTLENALDGAAGVR
jgi:zinc/manganese transport system substrate-binding protein